MIKPLSLSILLLFLCSLSLWGQEEELESQLIELVNEYRLSKELPALEQNEILTAVAFDQGEYILKTKRISHEQDNAKKKTLKDRLEFYEGLFNEAGENATIIGIESKAIVELGGERELIEDEYMALQAALTSWLKEDESKLNIEEKEFYSVGASVILNEKNELTIVLVTATKAYTPPNAKKVPFDLYGIEEYKKEACDQFLEDYPTLPQLFSDALLVENGEVILQYHNVEYLKSMLKGAKDKLAVELIQPSQFECNDGNALYPGEVADGYLLPPKSKSALNYHDLDSTQEGVKVSMGKVPPFFNPSTTELNLIFIKEGAACAKSKHNRVTTSKNGHLFNELLIAGLTKEAQYNWKDSVSYNYYPIKDKDWESSLREQLDFLNELKLSDQKLEMTCKKVGLVDETIEDRIRKIAAEYGITEVSIRDNESNFLSKLNGTFYQFDIEELQSKSEKRAFVKERIRSDEAFRVLVDSTVQVSATIEGNASIPNELDEAKRNDFYQKLYSSGRTHAALFLQQAAIYKLREDAGSKELPTLPLDQTQKDLRLLNNAIIEADLRGKGSYDGNTIHLAFLELFLIDKNDPIIRYNYLNATVDYWQKYPEKVSNPELWLKNYSVLSNNTSVGKRRYFRTLLNYYLLMTDYYYDTGQFDKRKKAFQQIKRIHANAQLNEKELLNFVQFLAHQDQFQMTINVLIKSLKEQMVKSHLLYYLQIAQYGEEGIANSDYITFMKAAGKNYPKELCQLFGNDQMGIQSLKNPSVKSLYCEYCQ